MPPRKRAPTGVKTPDEPGNEHLAAPHEGIPDDELSDDVNVVLDQLGEGASSVIVSRMKDNKPGEWEYVARIPAPDFNIDYVREQYGGGDYKVIIIDKVQGALNPVHFSIDRRFVGKLWGTMTPAPIPGAPAADPFKEDLLKILLAKALTPAPAAPALDAKTVLEIAALFKNDGGGASGLEMMKAVLEMSTTLAGVMNPPEGLAGVASQFLPIVDRLVPRTTAPVPRRIAAPAPAAAAAAAASPSLTVNQTNANPPAAAAAAAAPARVAGTIAPKWLQPFRTLAPMLVQLADNGNDPTVYADMAVDQLQVDDALFAAAFDAMNEKRLLSDLLAFAPALNETEQRKQFAAELVARIEEGIRDIMSQPDDDNANTDAAEHG